MNSCMTKSIEEIREANFGNKKRNKERSEFVRNILKKNERAIFELEKEGVGLSDIVRIINKCESTDITEYEVECIREEKERNLHTLATLVFMFLICLLMLIFVFGTPIIHKE